MTRSAPLANVTGLATHVLGRAAVSGLLVLGSAQTGLALEINETDGLAIKGYDPVAYFTEERPVPGSAAFMADYKGATFRFASAANQELFQSDPAAYAPQYGGFCAYATAKGYKADIDPAAFSVVSGKLYLNYNVEVQAEWQKDMADYIASGDRNWPAIAVLTNIAR